MKFRLRRERIFSYVDLSKCRVGGLNARGLKQKADGPETPKNNDKGRIVSMDMRSLNFVVLHIRYIMDSRIRNSKERESEKENGW